jgi:hypothetical protein
MAGSRPGAVNTGVDRFSLTKSCVKQSGSSNAEILSFLLNKTH